MPMFEDLISSFEITKVTFVDMWEILEAKGYFWECENHAGMETKRKRERERKGGSNLLGFAYESDEIKGWREKGEGDTWLHKKKGN